MTDREAPVEQRYRHSGLLGTVIACEWRLKIAQLPITLTSVS